ncbi:MAG TPA: nuclear transport factor 2 family protein [Acidimicrobiales bacterium]|nr:nuclear transport factor 2 family protein [Acidimicrobiales bacterium]
MPDLSTREVVEGYIDALNGGEPEAIAAWVAEDFVNEHTSSLGHSLTGRDSYRERLRTFLAQFRNLHYELEDLIVDGSRAAAPYLMTFRWRGEGTDPVPVRIRGMFRFEVAGGLVARRVDYWDSAEFERQVNGSGR